MRNVSNAVKALPDSLAEGMTKVSDNMGRMSERLGQDIKQSIFKVEPYTGALITHIINVMTLAALMLNDQPLPFLSRCLLSFLSLILTQNTVESLHSLMTM